MDPFYKIVSASQREDAIDILIEYHISEKAVIREPFTTYVNPDISASDSHEIIINELKKRLHLLSTTNDVLLLIEPSANE